MPRAASPAGEGSDRGRPRGRLLRSGRLALLVLALALGLAPGDAGAAGPSAPALTVGITQYPATLHPNIDSMLAKTWVLGLVRRPLTVYDVDWKLACMLCTTLPTLENGLARLLPPRAGSGRRRIAVTWEIHPEAVWGDGVPITAEDVVFTWEVGRDPRSGVASGELYRRIERIEVLGPRRFTLYFDRVTFDYNSLGGFELLPAHIERPVWEQGPETYRLRTRFDTEPTLPGLHAGPYRITALERGSYLRLEPNPRWWGKPPHFRQIVVRAIENTAALEANLLSGGIDYIAGELGLALDQALAFERRHGDRFRVLYKPGLIYEHIDLNLDNPILADRRVRKALILGADRQAISDRLFAGKQPVAHSNVSPLDRMFSPDVPRYPYDPGRAARLLEEAGWMRAAAGPRRDASGRPLSLELMTTAGNRTRELVEQVLQAGWQALGIDIRIRNEPARVFFGETIARRRFTGLAMYAWISAPESVPRSTLHSSEIPSAANGWSGQNAPGYRSPEMDRLLDAIEVELDRDRRRALWAELQRLYASDLPALPLYFRANAFILPRWLEGIEPTGHQYPTTLWAERWRRRP